MSQFPLWFPLVIQQRVGMGDEGYQKFPRLAHLLSNNQHSYRRDNYKPLWPSKNF